MPVITDELLNLFEAFEQQAISGELSAQGALNKLLLAELKAIVDFSDTLERRIKELEKQWRGASKL